MTTSPPAPSFPRSVVFVCTGNVCRSPFAELLLKERLPWLTVSSRGIHALAGQMMEDQMGSLLSERGVSSHSFRARQVQSADLEADLILTMSQRQRAHLVDEQPSAARRIGLLGHVPELAEHSRVSPAGIDRETISTWTRQSKPRGRDVTDPYRQPWDVAAQTASAIETYIDELAEILTAPRRAPGRP